MYTALQLIALTQAVGFEHPKNPLPSPLSIGGRDSLCLLLRLRCLITRIEPVLLEVDHRKLLGLRWVVLLLFLGDMCDLALVEGVVALVLL